jgi:radical SAM superfamily enzyme YgiQ (UPF0313 family)
MKVLLLYPRYTETFWGFRHALKFIGKKAAYPPLGLLTVASMLPVNWDKKLLDMNVSVLGEQDLSWADCVFISAMAVQRESVREVLEKCRKLGKKTVAGGPLFTMEPEEFPEADHLVLGEAEVTLPEFLKDFAGGCCRRVYTSRVKPALIHTPVPQWNLINFKDYASMSVQLSRGCPHHCDFCNITPLFGKLPRMKNAAQLVAELDSLYSKKWRGSVFIVDDNFIGNKAAVKRELLPALIAWMKERNYPFTFITEASINLADDETLLQLMRQAGFRNVFIGIETINEDGLKECRKLQNINRNMLASVRKIQSFGMQVSAGFIVGFDSDPPNIFDQVISFIQQSGIPTAMVGLLNAPQGTRLFERLKKENRLTVNFSGNNTDFFMNFIPKMDHRKLLEGYRRIVTTIYSPALYYERVLRFFQECGPVKGMDFPQMVTWGTIKAVLQVTVILGILEKGRKHFWKFLLQILLKHPQRLPDALVFAVYGFHFRKIFGSRPYNTAEYN